MAFPFRGSIREFVAISLRLCLAGFCRFRLPIQRIEDEIYVLFDKSSDGIDEV